MLTAVMSKVDWLLCSQQVYNDQYFRRAVDVNKLLKMKCVRLHVIDFTFYYYWSLRVIAFNSIYCLLLLKYHSTPILRKFNVGLMFQPLLFFKNYSKLPGHSKLLSIRSISYHSWFLLSLRDVFWALFLLDLIAWSLTGTGFSLSTFS